MDGVFVGSGIFKSSDPIKRARAIVQAVTHYKDAKVPPLSYSDIYRNMPFTWFVPIVESVRRGRIDGLPVSRSRVCSKPRRSVNSL